MNTKTAKSTAATVAAPADTSSDIKQQKIEPAQTLTMQIYDLLETYGLEEVLDRLQFHIEDQSRLPFNKKCQHEWVEVYRSVQAALDKSLEIKSVLGSAGQWD